MREAGSKLLLYLACSYMLIYTEPNTTAIFAFVLSLTVSGLCTYLSSSRRSSILIFCYAFLTLWKPIFGLYLPLFLYDAIYFSGYPAIGVTAACGIFSLFFLPKKLIFPLLTTYFFAAVLSLFCSQIQRLLTELHYCRDTSAETELHLRERNNALREKQDYEIHVATLSERNRIAREIHDNVGHMLTRSILQTGALKVVNKEPIIDEGLSTLNDTLNTAMTSIRESVHDLHDEAIDLQLAVTELVTAAKRPHISLTYDVEENVPKEMKYAFIAIIKEAINNMQKHSNADTSRIILREHPGFYQLQIRDNGTTASGKNVSITNGIGLTNMEERVIALGGNIEIDTGNGFCINISILKKEG